MRRLEAIIGLGGQEYQVLVTGQTGNIFYSLE